ncbi:hypothetical protein GQ53DRAFT_861941 [Thozetella sp. PMI_491]|nr:hypothetical protein GQ53DRAFT_861941 [Thozetella sp. PMI_491]
MMAPSTKYDVLEEESDGNSADLQSGYPRDHPQVPLCHQYRAPRLSACLLWYSAFSTTTILILSIVLLTVAFPKTAPTASHHVEDTASESCLDRPYRGILGRHRQYQSIDHRYDLLWDDIENDQRVITLPDPDQQGKETPAVIAMFHQLHCLQSFRLAIQMGHEGIDPGVNYLNEDMHWPHCLDYMRSSVLCWADATPERWGFLENGTLGDIAEGSWDDRRCGDNRKLIKIMRDAGRVVRTRPFP